MSVRDRKSRRRPRRPLPVKIPITTRIDADTLAAVRDIAQARRVGYQTLINEILFQWAAREARS